MLRAELTRLRLPALRLALLPLTGKDCATMGGGAAAAGVGLRGKEAVEGVGSISTFAPSAVTTDTSLRLTSSFFAKRPSLSDSVFGRQTSSTSVSRYQW